MNRANLKNYAPLARRDFIQAMTDRAAFYGLTAKKVEPVVEQGDVAVIAGREHPRAVVNKRTQLEARIQKQGFEQTMEAMAYTWFNRLVAIRFMELHGYLDHGYRVLSHPEGKPTPEILEYAEHVEFPGLKRETIIDLKVAGNKEDQLYRLLLSAQCNALHRAMPFLFERIDDSTELLIPDNLLHSDSLIRKLVNEIDEEDWQQVEIIGWLYQFYISEKKDEVIGKVVASENIPAATQLFTPNWIVKYLVQNTLGRQWLATYPLSALRQQLEYYIEPALQTPEVQEQLKTITPSTLNPEELTLLDPACGSGHILVEAYDLFKAIYQERGYRAKDIPALILKKNLFGMEIDDRAAQLAAFALMMKARSDDRRIFDSESKPNVLAFEDSQGMNAASITNALNSVINKQETPSEYLFEEIQEDKDGLFSKRALAESGYVAQSDIASLMGVFANAKTCGSLLQIPPALAAKLPEIERRLNDVLEYGDLTHTPAHVIGPLIWQAGFLLGRYDAVVANPPYMGSKYFSPTLKAFALKNYADSKADLCTCFIQRNAYFAKSNGFVGMLTLPNWMFLSSFEDVRGFLLTKHSIDTFLHNGRGVFGSDFGSCAFAFRAYALPHYRGTFRRLFDKQGSVASNDELSNRFGTAINHTPFNEDFAKIPGRPIAYWATRTIYNIFAGSTPLGSSATIKQGLATCNNDLFLRAWHEVSLADICFDAANGTEADVSSKRWFPYNKGGQYQRWYGNRNYVINWEHHGRAIHAYNKVPLDYNGAPVRGKEHYFRESLSWSKVTIGAFATRYFAPGFIFDVAGCSIFPSRDIDICYLQGLLNSCVTKNVLSYISPTVNYEVGQVALLPILKTSDRFVDLSRSVAASCLEIATGDWNSAETSWMFGSLQIVQHKLATLQQSLESVDAACIARFARMKQLEEENNRLFIEAYGLQDELSAEVPDYQITIYRPDRAEEIKRLISYAVGCIMGRFSLDKPGLIYAHQGNQNFDPSQYRTFPADDDGIMPLLESDWGIPDATRRLVDFVGVLWTKECLDENLSFIADSLGRNNDEQARDAIGRYLATGFYKHHLSMYKRRPIYWLFSSGKERAFQCLVYLHRYHEGTLARIRTEHVIPLQGQIDGRIEQLEGDKAKATSTSHRNKLQKEQTDLKKQQTELRIFEEKLKHTADQKISLDLDDGVKLNYGKFGDLLAESKAVTGGTDDE